MTVFRRVMDNLINNASVQMVVLSVIGVMYVTGIFLVTYSALHG